MEFYIDQCHRTEIGLTMFLKFSLGAISTQRLTHTVYLLPKLLKDDATERLLRVVGN